MWRSYSAVSSEGSRTVRPVRAVLTAFRDDLARPSSLRGPVDSWALAWLASRRASESVSAWRRFFSSFLAFRSMARRMDRAVMRLGLLEIKMARGVESHQRSANSFQLSEPD